MKTQERGFRPDVEGLRAVAVGLVVLCHAGVPGFEGGYIGVDVFFVLSGFLITGLLLKERETKGSTSLLNFYARRARRILPAASLVLLVTVLASYHWLGFLRGDTVAEDGKWTALFAANLHFAHEGTQYLNVTAPPSPLQHFWSLAVEEQFYLVWPLAFLITARVAPKTSLARKLAAVLCLVVAASLAWSVLQTDSDPVWAFFSPLTRAWELGAGALLAVSGFRFGQAREGLASTLSWAGLAGVVVAVLLFDTRTSFPGYAAVLPVTGTALVVAAEGARPRLGAGRVLGLAPLQLLGKWSYALYLWHWPLLVIAAERSGDALSGVERFELVAAAVFLAAATHYLLENPVRYAAPLTRRPWASVAVGLGVAAGVYGLCGWQLHAHAPDVRPALAAEAAPTPDSPVLASSDPPVPAAKPTPDPGQLVAALVEGAPEIQALPADVVPDIRTAVLDFAWIGSGCLVDQPVIESPPCVFGDPGGTRTIVLLGDSHIAMWLGAFDSIGKAQHAKVVLLSKTNCPAAKVSVYRSYGTGSSRFFGPYRECGSWLDASIARINELHPDLVILGSCSGCDNIVDSRGELVTRDAWRTGLEQTLQAITAPGTRRVVLGDIPRIPRILDCLALNPKDIQACSEPVDVATGLTYGDAEAAAARSAGVEYLDVTQWFCSAVCTPVVGGKVVYTNDYHVTATYAGSLATVLGEAVR